MESFVAIMALIAASILDPGLCWAMNAPAGVVGATAQTAAQAVTTLGFTISPDQLSAGAAAVQEKTTSRSCSRNSWTAGLASFVARDCLTFSDGGASADGA
jgi:carbon starvation protein